MGLAPSRETTPGGAPRPVLRPRPTSVPRPLGVDALDVADTARPATSGALHRPLVDGTPTPRAPVADLGPWEVLRLGPADLLAGTTPATVPGVPPMGHAGLQGVPPPAKGRHRVGALPTAVASLGVLATPYNGVLDGPGPQDEVGPTSQGPHVATLPGKATPRPVGPHVAALVPQTPTATVVTSGAGAVA